MNIKVINGKTGEIYHETKNILEASAAVSWLIPNSFLEDEEVTITVSSNDEVKK